MEFSPQIQPFLIPLFMQYSKYIKNIYALLNKKLLNRYTSQPISSTQFAIWSAHYGITSRTGFRHLQGKIL